MFSVIHLGSPPQHPIVFALVSFMLAALFIASYFFESRSKLFGYIIYFCKEKSFPGTRLMAFFYAGLLIFLAIGGLAASQ
jgi:hypothetical protein